MGTFKDPFDADFDNVKPPTDRGQKAPKGRYLINIDTVKWVVSTFGKNKGSTYWVVEYTVGESSNSEMPAGTKGSWLVGFDYPKYAQADIKGFISAATGEPFEQVTKELCNAATDASQPLRDTKLRLDVVEKERENKDPVLVHRFSKAPAKVETAAA